MLPAALKWSSLCVLAGAFAPGMTRAAETRGLPARLSDTGLYADGSTSQLRPGVRAFSPQYPLWSDGAEKRRWIYLPPGSSIDAAQPDAWNFPPGTKLWKEFSHGRAIETRYIERGADGDWRFASYVWNAEGTDAVLAPASGIRSMAAPAAPAGRYGIPAEDDCRACHEGAPVPVLGFSALQLSPDRDRNAPHAESVAVEVNLRSLAAEGLLRNLPPDLLIHAPRVDAANPVERAALGYLHGNCGHCHNDDGPLAVLDMTLAQRVGGQSPASDAVRRSIVGVRGQVRTAGAAEGAARIAPGETSSSVVAMRMHSRNPSQQMPPLGTEVVDVVAMSLIARWIESLSVH
jgi:hypothetical protein